MRTIILSDHTADRIKERASERDRQYEMAMAEYNNASATRQAVIDTIKKARSEAWRLRKFWQVITLSFELYLAGLQGIPRLPTRPMPDDSDEIWEAGRTGERRVHEYLDDKLDDSWILIAGYKNSRGEIDRILVGPDGIFSMEIKYINGEISCVGDRWWKDKHDNYGNLVEQNAVIEDKKGRGPSRQLNEPSDLLEKFLRRSYNDCRIYRIVIFAHDSSELNSIENMTVDKIVTFADWDMYAMFQEGKFKLYPHDIELVTKLIEQDHRYHQNGRQNGSLRGGQ